MIDKRLIIAGSLIALAVSAASCRNAEKEASRTSDQLGKLARDAGAEGVADSLREGYEKGVAPIISETDQVLANIETYQKAKALGDQAAVKLQELGNSASDSASRMARSMPQSEQELERLVDQKNQEFVAWLRKNFPSRVDSLKNGRGSDVSKSVSTKLKGRGSHDR